MSAMMALCRRELQRFYRQRDRVIGALATPFLFWLVIGAGFGDTFRFSNSYADYLFPGIIVLSLLFTAIFSTISIIEDRREGFLQSVLVAPISRISMVLGKILGATAIALIQAAIFLILAPLAGFRLTPFSIAAIMAVLFLIAFGFSSLGFLIAWRSSSTQGFHAIMNLFLMPMWLLSGAFFPTEGAPRWIALIMRANPLTYGMDVLRDLMFPGNAVSLASVMVTACFSAASLVAVVLTASSRGDSNLP